MVENSRPPYQSISEDEVLKRAEKFYKAREAITQPSDNPTIVLVAGQPGAGKTQAANLVKNELKQKGGYIHVDADRMRLELPGHELGYPSSDTQQDAARLVAALRRLAIQGRRNILEEGTFRDKEVVATFLKQSHAMGYQTDMMTVSASPESSLLGIYTRYENQIAGKAGNPRMVPESYHEMAFNGFKETVKAHAESFGHFRVINRKGEMLYDSQNATNQQSAYQALIKGHQLSEENLESLVKGWKNIVERAEGRGETNPAYIEAIQTHHNRVANLHKAEVFRVLPESEGVKKYPELKEAYGLRSAYVEQLGKQGLSPAIQADLLHKFTERAAESIAAGKMPKLNNEKGKNEEQEL